MTSIVVLVYLADLSDKLMPALGVVAFLTAIIWCLWKFALLSKDTKLPVPRKLGATFLTCIALLIAIPSSKTFYMFAGAQAVNTVVSSDLGKKVLDGLNSTIIEHTKQ